jgi:group I intron endonuclease
MFVYSIYNTINGKQYIGITNSISRRWREHRNDLKKNQHGNIFLQSACNKYGSKSFTCATVRNCCVHSHIYKSHRGYVWSFSKYNLLERLSNVLNNKTHKYRK